MSLESRGVRSVALIVGVGCGGLDDSVDGVVYGRIGGGGGGCVTSALQTGH